ncbi:hypothetical protein O181_078972 [Austropuccinia psidii MF-1]|uniref:Uncharacterized protein n=1 Tax=Austropuccinia psidii MF-1 TaxID=1389203 RepID=A0A9Q3FIT2_9BASI|nr:hypothetical protein [Austropuccinia psidii MF-1]
MPFQNSPPANDTRSQRNQAVLAPTASSPLDCTPLVHQTRTRSRLEEAENGEGVESAQEEDSEDTEVETSLEGAPEASEAPNIALSNHPLISQDDGENYSIHGTTHSSSCSQGQLQSHQIQDPFHEGT